MEMQQYIVFGTLIFSLVFFIWGRWRYDIVAVTALLIVTITGIVPGRDAFSGFGHPAVITVAAVLIITSGLMNSGMIDLITNQLFKIGNNITLQIVSLTVVVAVLSAFINNVGALAIMLPVSLQIARKNNYPPSFLLMPIAFGSLLGGLTTMMGTPPNIIIALARAESGNEPFRIFDYTPVGAVVAVAGILFISLVGWRLLPKRRGQASLEELFNIEDYTTEVRVSKNSTIAGSRIWELGKLKDIEVNIIGIARGKRRILQPSANELLHEDDVLVIEADSDDLKEFVDAAKLELAGDEELRKDILGSEDMIMLEAVVMRDSSLTGKTAYSLHLRRKYGLNLIAVARKGSRIKQRIASIRFQPGDVLLLNGPSESIAETISEMGCIPLARRNLRIGQPKRIIQSTVIFLSAIMLAAFGFLPIQTALVSAAAVMVLVNLISIREIYDNVDWSVIILLGAMIPLGNALETTGAAGIIVMYLLKISGQMPPFVSLVIILVGTMFLSDIINNAAAAVLIAPIAVEVASTLGVSPDPFLMSVALGASCAFLTPVGHQSNTLVMGPGGYKFGDYWRLGLPLEIIILIVGVPMICIVWPF
ncbi:MAG TPA: SLC13 family permease [Desulfobacteraceae bacterium]|nr:SLC13 family permease [Desulfobacteraceae bacterium]HPJ67457.1 SLC13 family permease [Desulfobacteraceae bacterium]HPQ27506.1 SLC13 family permease [Desulfobacteraceae bacterium]